MRGRKAMRHHSAEVLFCTHQPALRRHRVPLRLVRAFNMLLLGVGGLAATRTGIVPARATSLPDLTPTPHRQWAHHTGSGAPLQTGRYVHFDSGITDLGDTGTEVFGIRWPVDGHDVNPPAYGSRAGIRAHTAVLNGNSRLDRTPTSQAPTPSR